MTKQEQQAAIQVLVDAIISERRGAGEFVGPMAVADIRGDAEQFVAQHFGPPSDCLGGDACGCIHNVGH